ncbi:MAG: M48 family metalloprotease [Candidatus Margulisiibacteriota bacterium]
MQVKIQTNSMQCSAIPVHLLQSYARPGSLPVAGKVFFPSASICSVGAGALKVVSDGDNRYQMLIADCGKLPDDHPAVNYVRDLAKRVCPGFDGKIVVMPNYPESNGFVMSGQNAVCLSVKLLNELKYEEELAFVLSHELVHANEKHAETRGRDPLEQAGIMRGHETEADFVGVDAVDGAGINPYGGVEFFRSRAKKENGSSFSHGSSQDRELNLLSAVPHRDLENLSHVLTPLPDYIKNLSAGQPLSKRVLSDEQFEKIAKTANIYQIRVMMKTAKDKRKAVLIERMHDYVKKLLLRKGMPVEYSKVCLGFLCVNEETFPDDELTWFSINGAKVLLGGEIGMAPLEAGNADGYCRQFADFFLKHSLAKGAKEYLKYKCALFHEISDKLPACLTEDETRKYLTELIVKEGLAPGKYAEEIELLAAKRNIGYVNLLVWSCEFFTDITARRLVGDFGKYYGWNMAAARSIGKTMDAAFIAMEGRHVHFEGAWINEPFKGMELYDRKLSALEQNRNEIDLSLGILFSFYQGVMLEHEQHQYSASHEYDTKGQKIENAEAVMKRWGGKHENDCQKASRRFESLMECLLSRRHPHLSKDQKELIKKIFMSKPDQKASINLSATPVEDLNALFEVFRAEGLWPEMIFGFYGEREQVRYTHSNCNDYRRDKPKTKNPIYLYQDIVYCSSEKDYEEKLRALFRIGAYENLFKGFIGEGDLKPKREAADIRKLERMNEIYREAVRGRAGLMAIRGFPADVRVSLRQLVRSEIPLKEKMGMLSSLNLLHDEGLVTSESFENKQMYANFVRESVPQVGSFESRMVLTLLIPDKVERRIIQRHLLLTRIKELDFDKAVEFLEQYDYLREESLFPALEYFYEHMPKTIEEHERALELAGKRLKNKERASDLGILSMAESAGHGYLSGAEMLAAGLASGTDERRFKGYLFEPWVKAFDIGHADASLLRLSPDHSSYFPSAKWLRGATELYARAGAWANLHTSGSEYRSPLTYFYGCWDRRHEAIGHSLAPSFVDVVQDAYTMDSYSKEMLIRRGLIGDEGVLKEKSKRHELADQLLEYRLKADSQSDLKGTISEVIHALMEQGEDGEIYPLLSAILRDNFLVPPEEEYPYHLLAEEKAGEAFAQAQAEYLDEHAGAADQSSPDFYFDEFSDEKTLNALYKAISGKSQGSSLYALNKKLTTPGYYHWWKTKHENIALSPRAQDLVLIASEYMHRQYEYLSAEEQKNIRELSRELLEITYPECPKRADRKETLSRRAAIAKKWLGPHRDRLIAQMGEETLYAMIGEVVDRRKYEEVVERKKEAKLFSLFGLPPAQPHPAMMPIELTLQGVQTLSPVGVRGLQLLGQYADEIPEEYQEQFEQVYDSMKGQTRLSGYAILKREAKRNGLNLNNQLFKEIAVLGERIGGGSLVSVYKITLINGDELVLKVSNPNSLFRTESAMRIVRKVVDELALKHPERASDYAAVRMMFEDIAEWIVRDFKDERFYENDRAVYQRYHGYGNGGPFTIRIPKHRELQGPYLRAEEFVNGQNLTKVRIEGKEKPIEGGRMVSAEEFKELVCLSAQVYLDMILSGLVHSDLSPGNISITAENEVALLDRSFYLELTPTDISLIKNITASVNDPAQLADKIAEYLVSLPSNKEKAGQKSALAKLAKEALEGRSDNWEKALIQTLVKIKKAGFKVPIEFTLLIKNLKVLNNMAKRAGFESLLECTMFRPNDKLFEKIF